MLVEAGADPDARDRAGWTPLHWIASENDHPAAVEALLEAGADPNARSTRGETPLHLAARWTRNPAVFKALLAASADAKTRDGAGMTAHDLARDNPAFADADALQNLETVPFEPFGPNWIVAENQPCQLYNPDPEPGETIIWSGDCVNGTASGEGEVVWRGRYGVEVYEGEYRNGYEHGYGRFTLDRRQPLPRRMARRAVSRPRGHSLGLTETATGASGAPENRTTVGS